ncbi:hypothetical protein [Roseococcus microcysteis]|uniref:hypothetical protein n=1 Tax=Roseococcus microcysteis TaxID=2771361 RepID=UPI00168AE93B|nr:hypothetical protein [Roseococcus microcysteis]
MAGLRIQTSGAVSSPFLAISPRVGAGLTALHTPRSGAPDTTRNYAAGGSAGTITGTPTYTDRWARFTSQSAYMSLAAAELDVFTVMALARPAAEPVGNTTGFPILSNITLGTSGFLFGFISTGGGPRLLARRVVLEAGNPTNGSTAEVSISAAPTAWRFCVAKFTAAGWSVHDLTASTSNTRTDARTPVKATGALPRMGSSLNTYTGQGDVAWLQVFNRATSLDEDAAMYAQVQAFFEEEPVPLTGF